MVIAYDTSWLSRVVIGSLLRVDTVTLVNLVAESRTIPEFLGPACRPEPIAAALDALMGDGTARQAQLDAMALSMALLGAEGAPPGERAAASVLAAISR
jgi:lipid-A-disaccharide synthase